MSINIKPSHEGRLHKVLGVAAGKSLPAGKVAAAKNSDNADIRKMATFAQNAKTWNHKGKGAMRSGGTRGK